MFREQIFINGSPVEETVEQYRFQPAPAPTSANSALLVVVHGRAEPGSLEWHSFQRLELRRIWVQGRQGWVDFSQLQVSLTPAEGVAVQKWLQEISWPAWARASEDLRALTGVIEPLLALADAARETNMPYITLSKAVAANRVPAVVVGGASFVYQSTIIAARARGLLGRLGRPKRGV